MADGDGVTASLDRAVTPSRCGRWGPRLARVAALAGCLGATVVCGGRSGAHTLPVTPGAAPEAMDDYDRAIARFRATGEASGVEAMIAARPDDPRTEIWREMLALQAYDAAFDPWGTDDPDATAVKPEQLVAVASEYPGTFAAQMATAGIENDALAELKAAPLGSKTLAFLAGSDAWAAGAASPHGLRIDREGFRRRHAPALADKVAAVILADGCRDTMGYCTWWVEHLDHDPRTEEVRRMMKQVWYKRGRPGWRSKRYATCMRRCARTCRDAAKPLDDSCWEPCAAACG